MTTRMTFYDNTVGAITKVSVQYNRDIKHAINRIHGPTRLDELQLI